MEYATCRWNQMFSSAGNAHARRGRTTRMMFRSMGTKIKPPSKARTRPAPREVHTDHLRPFRAESFLLVSYTISQYISRVLRRRTTHLAIPSIAKEEELEAVEEDIKYESSRIEEFAVKPAFAHGRQGLCFEAKSPVLWDMSSLQTN